MRIDARLLSPAPTGRFAYLRSRLPAGPVLCLNVGNVGYGYWSFHEELQELVSSHGGKAIGCELDSAAAVSARHPNQTVGDVMHLPFAEGTFDIAYLGQVTEHLWEPRQAFLGLHRVLKGGGYLILDTPHVYSADRMLRWMVLGKDDTGHDDHKILYTPAILVNLLVKTGFEVLDLTTDRKWSIGRWRLPWMPWGNRLGSHLLLTAVKLPG